MSIAADCVGWPGLQKSINERITRFETVPLPVHHTVTNADRCELPTEQQHSAIILVSNFFAQENRSKLMSIKSSSAEYISNILKFALRMNLIFKKLL